MARRIRRLELDVLLINPERSPHYQGIRANLLRPGYGTDQFRQNLRSIAHPVERSIRGLLRQTPPVRRKRRIERGFYQGGGDPPDVLAISRYMEGQVRDTYDVPDDRIHVVPNGVDLVAFSPSERAALRAQARAEFQIPEGGFCILFVAHNFRLKGVRQGMEALARLRGRGVPAHLLVAGRGTGRRQRARARGWARRLGVGGAVHMPGAVHPAIRAFAAADVFLHPSWHDAFGFAVLEAMAAGLPVVTSPFAGASQLVEEGVSGFVTRPDQGEAILAHLTALHDPELRGAMGRAARRVAEGYGEDESFGKVERVCRIAAERTGGPVR